MLGAVVLFSETESPYYSTLMQGSKPCLFLLFVCDYVESVVVGVQLHATLMTRLRSIISQILKRTEWYRYIIKQWMFKIILVILGQLNSPNTNPGFNLKRWKINNFQTNKGIKLSFHQYCRYLFSLFSRKLPI